MPVPEWNAEIITPESESGMPPLATNGGLGTNAQDELEVKVDGSTITVNGDGELEALGGGGSVTDVEVNGTSVVNASGVAEVTVPAQVNADWNAVSGAAEILNKPNIPNATSDLTNDSGFITLSDVPAQVNADWNSSSGASEILNKPTIPSGTQLVPAATSVDADKVLTVNSSGTPVWATPSGGGGSSEVIGAFNYTDLATYESINKVIIGSNTGDAYKTLVGTGSWSDDLFGYHTFGAQTSFVSGSTLVWINPQGQDWGNLLSVNRIFGLGEFRTMTGTDSTQLTFDHPVPGSFKGQGRFVQFASNHESNYVIWEAQFDMPEFDNGSYTWYYNKAYTCKVNKVNGAFTSGYGLLFVIVNGEDAPDFYEHNLSYIADYILTGNYLYGYSGNNIIRASKSVTLDKVNGVPNTSGYSQGDVLTINSNGDAVWATPSGGTTYTAGNMISLANDAIAVSTTAGITDVQQVASLPANPVSTVLYLIPET